jgi:hypothetical protein
LKGKKKKDEKKKKKKKAERKNEKNTPQRLIESSGTKLTRQLGTTRQFKRRQMGRNQWQCLNRHGFLLVCCDVWTKSKIKEK